MAIVRPHSVLPDANIWCSATLHSWFGLIAAETIGSWTFHWTEDILAEAVYHRRKRFPRASSKQIEALRDRLMASMGENRISSFPIDESVTYPDECDAHVHSAAIHEGIAIIVSNDRTGFTGLYPDPDDCPYEVHTADEFLTLVADSAPQVVDAVITAQLIHWTGKGHSFSLPDKLRRAQAPHFAEYVRARLQTIPLPSSASKQS
ncbi:PIN domain-containing protein [Dietzia maris]|uniref:PIN domain-containing protein n=1 Tax=Dietzia maris TaxID=37915 RepID=A0AAE4QYZ1_9ACTN|nr:PIN domain-containing protein [Dietzia maris]MDV6300916.1 PIN domain-containing protein [Dietzia maris]